MSEQIKDGGPVKDYPLDVRSCGGDTYTVYSKGHHDQDTFMRAVRIDGYGWPLGYPKHEWWRTVPVPSGWTEQHGYCDSQFVEACPGSPGAYPVTVSYEAFNENKYESIRDAMLAAREAKS